MKINVIGRLKGYAYAEGEHDMPKEHAEIFLDAGKGNLPDSRSSSDYNVSEVVEMVKDMDENEKQEFIKNDNRKTVQKL